jgi:hypothetical protein
MNASINIPGLFPRGWPKSGKSNYSRIGKVLKPSHVRGMVFTPGSGIFISHNRAGVNETRLYRNSNIRTLPDGVYLFLIEYEPSTRKYYKQFVRVESLVEIGSKHLQLPTHQGDRVVLAAGELVKNEGKITWNLRSGTFMGNFIRQGGGSNAKFRQIVENAFRNSEATLNFKNVNLIPNVPTKLGNLIKAIEAQKVFAEPVNSNNSEVLPYLKKMHESRIKAGLTTQNNGGGNAGPSGNTPQSKKKKINNK